MAGIGHYGNSIGVPTVGGEIYFESSYEQNCLVNAMCLGLARHERLIRSAAAGTGNVVVLLGALTGRDGIGGASVLASAELGEGDEAKRPSVQIGDPFTEKKLLECCLELLDRELLVSLQDLGAAGLTSAASEMAASGGVGITIDLCQIPLREPDMEPFEIMVSESQERMLCVASPECVGELLDVCERWEVLATTIGCVTDGDALQVLHRGSVVANVPVSVLVDDCPLYDLEPAPPVPGALYGAPEAVLSERESPAEALLALLRSPNLASRRPVFEQYDPVVQSRTVRRPDEADAAVLMLAGGRRRHRGVDRRQRPARGMRPAPRRRRGGVRMCRQPRLRGSRAARVDQLPELRQSREAARGLAADRGGRGSGGGVRGARNPRGGRERVPVQRGARRPDLPDTGGRDGWQAPRRGSGGAAGLRL